MALLAHDLKTPMTSMSNGLNELKKNILTDEKCTELIELMQTSNAGAMDFVADLVAGMKILSRESKDGT